MSASAGTTLIPECTAFRCSHYMPAQMLIAQWQTIKTLSCTPYTGLRRQNALPLNVEIRYQLADARAHGHQNDPGIRTVHTSQTHYHQFNWRHIIMVSRCLLGTPFAKSNIHCILRWCTHQDYSNSIPQMFTLATLQIIL